MESEADRGDAVTAPSQPPLPGRSLPPPPPLRPSQPVAPVRRTVFDQVTDEPSAEPDVGTEEPNLAAGATAPAPVPTGSDGGGALPVVGGVRRVPGDVQSNGAILPTPLPTAGAQQVDDTVEVPLDDREMQSRNAPAPSGAPVAASTTEDTSGTQSTNVAAQMMTESSETSAEAARIAAASELPPIDEAENSLTVASTPEVSQRATTTSSEQVPPADKRQSSTRVDELSFVEGVMPDVEQLAQQRSVDLETSMERSNVESPASFGETYHMTHDILGVFDAYEPAVGGNKWTVKMKGSDAGLALQQANRNVVMRIEDFKNAIVGTAGDVANVGGKVGKAGLKATSSVVGSGRDKAADDDDDEDDPLKRITEHYDDEYQDVDILGTRVRDATTMYQEEASKGANTADSPLDNPFILMIFPILPIAALSSYTVLRSVLPFVWRVIRAIFLTFGLRFWVFGFLILLLLVVLNWQKIRKIEALKMVVLKVEISLLTLEATIKEKRRELEPIVMAKLDKFWPQINKELRKVDSQGKKLLGYSVLDAIIAKVHGWKFDGRIQEMFIDSEGDESRSNEAIYNIDFQLSYIDDIHTAYKSVWVEWHDSGMIVCSTAERDVAKDSRMSMKLTSTGQHDDVRWKRYGADMDNTSLQHEVMMPFFYYMGTDENNAVVTDEQIRLVLKGRKEYVIYNNDGAPRFQRNMQKDCVIGEALLSAKKIGVEELWSAPDNIKEVHARLRVPFRSPGLRNYRAAVLHASAIIKSVNASSYSYRDNISDLPVGDWTVRVGVYELRELHGVDSGGNSDPFVDVTVFGQMKQTQKVKDSLSCVLDEDLFFSKSITGDELEGEEVTLVVMDWNRIRASKKIGQLIMNLKSIYQMRNHEFYRMWYPLSPPGPDVDEGSVTPGYVKLSVAVIPPGSVPTAHSAMEDREEYTQASLLKSTVLQAPALKVEKWILHLTLGWADMLPRMTSSVDKDVIRGYCELSLTGMPPLTSKTFIAEARPIIDNNVSSIARIMPRRKVIFNEEFIFPLFVAHGVVNSERIRIALHHRSASSLGKSMLVGEVELSYKDIVSNMRTAIVRGHPDDDEVIGDRYARVAMIKPRYHNFYGDGGAKNPRSAKKLGFRGRMLVALAAKPGTIKQSESRPCRPPPHPRVDLYRIDFTVMRATELSLKDGNLVRLEVRIGPYIFDTPIPSQTVKADSVAWQERNVLHAKNLQFPANVAQIPDMFITLFTRTPATLGYFEVEKDKSMYGVSQSDKLDATEESRATDSWRRFAFVRVPANNLLLRQKTPSWMFMDSTDSEASLDDEVPGSLLFCCRLRKTNRGVEPMGREVALFDDAEQAVLSSSHTSLRDSPYIGEAEVSSDNGGAERLYTLKALVLQGRDLPASDASGLSDPFVRVAMGDRQQKGAVTVQDTVCPIWEEEIVVCNISIREHERRPNVNVLVYDHDDTNDYDFLGRAIVPGSLLTESEVDPHNARWYDVFSVNPEIKVGAIQADFQLIPQYGVVDVNLHEMGNTRMLELGKARNALLRVAMVGLRSIKFLRYAHGTIDVELVATGQLQSERSRRVAVLQQSAYQGAANLLDVRTLRIEPTMDNGVVDLNPSVSFLTRCKYTFSPGEEIVGATCVRVSNAMLQHSRSLRGTDDLDRWDESTFAIEALPSLERYKELRQREVVWKSRTLAEMAKEKLKLAVANLHAERAHNGHRAPSDAGGSDDGMPREKSELEAHQKYRELTVGFERPSRQNMSPRQRLADKMRLNAVRDVFRRELPAAAGRVRHSVNFALFSVADSISSAMPDVAMRLGIEAELEEPASAVVDDADDDLAVMLDSSMLVKRRVGTCEQELEKTFCHPLYGEYPLYRGDNRNTGAGGMELDPKEMDFIEGKPSLVRKELERTLQEGRRPVVGVLKASLQPVLLDSQMDDQQVEDATEKLRYSSLLSFASCFDPREVIVRVHVLRGINLLHKGGDCNPYLTVEFIGGFPERCSTKVKPVLKSSDPDFFEMFESRITMPGGVVRITVKDRVLPEVPVLLPVPMLRKWKSVPYPWFPFKDFSVNLGKRGLGYSEEIGETTIDLDHRWYNPEWQALALPPVETRSLTASESANLRGSLEVMVQMIDARKYDRNSRDPRYRPISVSRPQRRRYNLRVVIFRITDSFNPKNVDQPEKTSDYFVKLRLGNSLDDERRSTTSRNSPDGTSEFNERMGWWVELPDNNLKPRLKVTIYDDTSMGIGDDDLCAMADLKLMRILQEVMFTNKTVVKKKQWIICRNPDYENIQARLQMAVEVVPEHEAHLKTCKFGSESWDKEQHVDYILPKPFRPVAFSVLNPVPYFTYLIQSLILSLVWTFVMALLVSPFIPMAIKLAFMIPWWWWFLGGLAGALVVLRLQIVQQRRQPVTPRTSQQAQIKDIKEKARQQLEHMTSQSKGRTKADKVKEKTDPMLHSATPVSSLLNTTRS